MNREVRPPVDRDDEPRLDPRDGLCRSRRIEMATAAETRPPAPDGDEADVHRPELAHLVEEVGVAREVDRLRAGHDVADRIRRHADRAPAPVVVRPNRTNLQLRRWRASRRPPPRSPTRTAACGACRRGREARRPGSSSRASRATADRGGRSARARRARRRLHAASAPRRASSAAGARRGCAAADPSAGGRRRDRRRPSRDRRIRFAPSAKRYTHPAQDRNPLRRGFRSREIPEGARFARAASAHDAVP